MDVNRQLFKLKRGGMIMKLIEWTRSIKDELNKISTYPDMGRVVS